jgi:hypothetical protein
MMPEFMHRATQTLAGDMHIAESTAPGLPSAAAIGMRTSRSMCGVHYTNHRTLAIQVSVKFSIWHRDGGPLLGIAVSVTIWHMILIRGGGTHSWRAEGVLREAFGGLGSPNKLEGTRDSSSRADRQC